MTDKRGIVWDQKKLSEAMELSSSMTQIELANHYGVSKRRIQQVLERARNLQVNGKLQTLTKKGFRTDKPEFNLRETLARFGYDPALGIVEYRQKLEALIKQLQDQLEVAQYTDNHGEKQTTTFMPRGDARDETLMAQLMALWREAASMDTALMPYVHPKLNATSVSVQDEKPPLLIIGEP